MHWKHSKTPPQDRTMASHWNAQLHSVLLLHKNKENAAVSIDQDAEMEKNEQSAGSSMACKCGRGVKMQKQSGSRCEVLKIPGRAMKKSVQWREETAHLSTYNQQYSTGPIQVNRHGNSSKWHSSFGTGSWQMRTHTHTVRRRAVTQPRTSTASEVTLWKETWINTLTLATVRLLSSPLLSIDPVLNMSLHTVRTGFSVERELQGKSVGVKGQIGLIYWWKV